MGYTYTVYDHSGVGSYAGEEYSWADKLTITEVGAEGSGITVRVSRSALGNNINIQSTLVAFTCDGQTVKHTFPGHNTPGYGQWWYTDDAELEFPASWVNKKVSFTASGGAYYGTFVFEGYAGFRLTVTDSDKCRAAVSRTSSPKAGAKTGSLADGENVYSGDVLKITCTPAAGYKGEIKINGKTVLNSAAHTVSSAVAVAVTAEPMATVHLYNGSSWGIYLIYVGTGSAWQLGQANIFNGSVWNKYF